MDYLKIVRGRGGNKPHQLAACKRRRRRDGLPVRPFRRHPAAEGPSACSPPPPPSSHLYRLFPDSPDGPTAPSVAADDVPEPYHQLLVHTTT